MSAAIARPEDRPKITYIGIVDWLQREGRLLRC